MKRISILLNCNTDADASNNDRDNMIGGSRTIIHFICPSANSIIRQFEHSTTHHLAIYVSKYTCIYLYMYLYTDFVSVSASATSPDDHIWVVILGTVTYYLLPITYYLLLISI